MARLSWYGCLIIGIKTSLAVDEMGDRLATINMGQKLGEAVPLSERGSWVPI